MEEIRVKIVDGADDLTLANEYWNQWVVHRRAFREYRDLMATRRDFKSDVHVFWGETGTGKTRRVFEEAEDLWIVTGKQPIGSNIHLRG